MSALNVPSLKALPVGAAVTVRAAGGRETMTRVRDGFVDAAGNVEDDLFAMCAWDARIAGPTA